MKSILIALLCFCGSAHAANSFYIEAAGGLTYFHQYKKDNARWYQDAYPWTAGLKSPAWRIGLGRKIDKHWDLTLSWLEIGRNSVVSLAVLDQDYDPIAHSCIRNCDKPTRLVVNGSGHGPEIAWRRSFGMPYVRGGVFLWFTKLQAHYETHDGTRGTFYQEPDIMIAPFLGVGARYKWKPIELFTEVTYYHGLGSGGYPIAKRATVPMVGARFEF